MSLECAICLNLLSEASSSDKAEETPAPPPAKRPRTRRSSRNAAASPSSPAAAASSRPQPQNDNVSATKCGHVFHKTCLIDWLKNVSTCPACRKPVFERQLLTLYLPRASDVAMDRLAKESGNKDQLDEIMKQNQALTKENIANKAELQKIKMEKEELNQRHCLLMTDYEELSRKFEQEQERANILEGRVVSLQQNNRRESNTSTIVLSSSSESSDTE